MSLSEELTRAEWKIDVLEEEIEKLKITSLKSLFKDVEIFFDYGQPNLPDLYFTAHCYYNNKSESCVIKIKDGKLIFEF